MKRDLFIITLSVFFATILVSIVCFLTGWFSDYHLIFIFYLGVITEIYFHRIKKS